MLEPLLFFVGFVTVALCVGASIGALWRGRLVSLMLCTGGLALVCTVGGVAWLIQIDPNRPAYDFHTFAGVRVFVGNVLIFVLGALTLFFGGGVGGALVGYAVKKIVKEKLVDPPKLPTPPPAPAA